MYIYIYILYMICKDCMSMCIYYSCCSEEGELLRFGAKWRFSACFAHFFELKSWELRIYFGKFVGGDVFCQN